MFNLSISLITLLNLGDQGNFRYAAPWPATAIAECRPSVIHSNLLLQIIILVIIITGQEKFFQLYLETFEFQKFNFIWKSIPFFDSLILNGSL